MPGRSPLRRVLYTCVLAAAAIALAGGAAFLVAAWQAQPDFRPIGDPISAAQSATFRHLPKYQRPEGATYLTFPEWYLVFNPQEYARFIATRPPSQFPFFRSIGQFWWGYTQVSGITRRHYPFDAGEHLMVGVIGVSTTVEYTIRGLYETTAGRVTEWLDGAHTAEDVYAVEVARQYGDFIPTLPWFEFPFGQKLLGLWKTTGVFGPHFLRKTERKFSLSLEYGVKAAYAGVIRLASRAVYGVADDTIYLAVEHVPDAVFADPRITRVERLGEHGWIITLPHYQGFTDTAPLLAAAGADFIDVAGNDEILLTLTAPVAWQYDLSAGRTLFTMPVLDDPTQKRVAIQAPVKSLGSILREAGAKNLRVEHLFDY